MRQGISLRAAAFALFLWLLCPQAATAGGIAPGCNGVQAPDKPGDVEPAGMDILRAWADHADGRTTITVEIADLTREVSAGHTFRAYDVNYSVGGGAYSQRAAVDPAGQVTFWRWATNPFVADPTTGEFAEGPGGYIRFTLPEAAAGSVLNAFEVGTREFVGIQPLGGTYDAGDAAKSSLIRWTVGTCPAPPAEPAAAPITTPPVAAVTATAERGTQQLRVTVVRISRRGRTLLMTLRSSAPIAGLRARLGGARTLATGRLARLGAAGTLKLVGRRRVPAGRYALRLQGNVDGAARGATLTVRVPR